MTLPIIPTVLVLGACFGLLGGGLTFWATHNYRATAITAISVFTVALVYLALSVLQKFSGA